MTTADQARCEEIERRLALLPQSYPAEPVYLGHLQMRVHVHPEQHDAMNRVHADIHFLIDLARTADAMLRTAFLDHGLDADALIAAAEQQAAMKCREIAEKGSASTGGVVADAITAEFNLPPLEDAGR